jgi:hypothetical protein
MNFKEFVGEMTMVVKSYEQLGDYLKEFDHLLTDGEHCGDIEKFKIYKKQRGKLVDYGAFLEDKVVAFFVMKDDMLMDAFVTKEHRKIGLFSAFLFFLKRNEGHSQIRLSDSHSEDTVEAVKRIYKRFDVYWEKDGKKEKYDPLTVDQYTSRNKGTGWTLVLENDGDFSHWQKFYHKKLQDDTRILEMLYFEPFVEDMT